MKFFLSVFALGALAKEAKEVAAPARNLNKLLDASWYTYGDLHHRPAAGYHYRSDWPLTHGSHLLTNPASTGLPATAGCLPVRDELFFRSAPRLRGPTYATDTFWNRPSHNLYAQRYHHLDRVAPLQFNAVARDCDGAALYDGVWNTHPGWTDTTGAPYANGFYGQPGFYAPNGGIPSYYGRPAAYL